MHYNIDCKWDSYKKKMELNSSAVNVDWCIIHHIVGIVQDQGERTISLCDDTNGVTFNLA